MKEAIERVIAELEKQKANAEQRQKTAEGHWAFKYWGVEVGLSEAIDHLKAVLANGENDSSGIPRNDGQAQEQNEKRDHAG